MNKINIDKTFGVYSIKCTIDSKLYVGSTCKTFSYRWRQWRYQLRKGTASNKHLQNAWNKYGEDAFEFSILEVVENIELVLEREQYYIDTLAVLDTLVGYNVNKNAVAHRLGTELSEETKEKLRGNTPWNKGKKGEYSLGPHTEEAKQKMREAATGREVSKETRKKIGEAGKGRISANKGKPLSENQKKKLSEAKKGTKLGPEHHMFGKHHSQETKDKISKANKGRLKGDKNPFFGKTHTEEVKAKLRLVNLNKSPQEAHSFRLIDPEGNLHQGTNIKQFCKENNLCASCICLVKKGKQKSHKGWTLG